MKTYLQLRFSSITNPELDRFEFVNSVGARQVSVRGRDGGALARASTGTFPWTRAVKALSVLVLRTYLSHVDEGVIPVISGYRGSMAASLDYALSKEPQWIVDLFGTDSSGRASARRLVKRTNPECKRPGPVFLGLNEHLIDASSIEIIVGGERINSEGARRLVAILASKDESGEENAEVAAFLSRGPAAEQPVPMVARLEASRSLPSAEGSGASPAADGAAGSCPLGPALQTAWERLSARERLMIFDEEGLSSLTVQEAALATARITPGSHVIDAFCGAGGSAIGFARSGKTVTAIDINRDRLEMARYNATLFGVADKIEFIHGDARDLLKKVRGETVFLAPCLGGPQRPVRQATRLDNFSPNANEMLALALHEGRDVLIQLPHDFDFNDLKQIRRPVTVNEERVNGELVSYTALVKAA